ncbi:MAG TPA: PKD domain-containing protein, partial [Nitrospiria bacterium]|nr:PKD domain-containing protein [Nitrospiria bacterium]
MDPFPATGGAVIHNFDMSPILGHNSQINDLVVQPNGQILAVGETYAATLTRYNSDGSLDTGFGTGGYVLWNQGFTFGSKFLALTIQPDGKIIAVGTHPGAFTAPANFAVLRYNSDGTPDTGFGPGMNGKVLTDFGGLREQAEAVVVQSDGKIVVGGWARRDGRHTFAVARYNSDGTLDGSFNKDDTPGKYKAPILTAPAGHNTDAYLLDVAIQPDGKILGVGQGGGQIILMRLLPGGTPDPTFGTGGFSKTVINGATGSNLHLLPDGRIIVNLTNGFRIAMFDNQGNLDMSFANNGIAASGIAPVPGIAYSGDMVVQMDGRVILGGYSTDIPTTGTFQQFYGLVRFEGLNSPPVADTGPDQTVDENTLVMLDGSASSDPDSDPLTFSWVQTGGPAVLLSDPTAVMPTFTAPDVMADTLLTFDLTVDDGNGGSDTDTVNITVSWIPTPTELTQQLIDTVIGFDLPDGIENSLLAKLNGVLAKIDSDPATACNKLDSFINQVQARSGKKIDPAEAALVIFLAE